MIDSSDEDSPQKAKKRLSDSPVLKGKGKRRKVILDSDEEDENEDVKENGVAKCEDMPNGGVVDRGTGQEEAGSKDVAQTPPTSPSHLPEARNNGVAAPTPSEPGTSNGVSIATPPRRATGN